MLDQLTVLITYLIVVSIAAERATDIFKRAFVLKFKVENFNGALYQFTTGVSVRSLRTLTNLRLISSQRTTLFFLSLLGYVFLEAVVHGIPS